MNPSRWAVLVGGLPECTTTPGIYPCLAADFQAQYLRYLDSGLKWDGAVLTHNNQPEPGTQVGGAQPGPVPGGEMPALGHEVPRQNLMIQPNAEIQMHVGILKDIMKENANRIEAATPPK
jgi:hypothetical protein